MAITVKKELMTETLSFSCSKTMKKRVDDLAAKYDRKPAWILRNIVGRYFDAFVKAQIAGK